MTDIAAGFPLVETDRWIARKTDLLNITTCTAFAHFCYIERRLIQFQVTQETDIVGYLKMLFLSCLEVAGIAGDVVSIQRFEGPFVQAFRDHGSRTADRHRPV